ncbi:MAG: DUF711 family protein [Promethearchaeota archaeon]
MQIRAITIGLNIPFLQKNEVVEPFLEEKISQFKDFFDESVDRLKDININVQTKRLCSQPLFSYEEQRIYSRNLEDTLLQINEQFELIYNIIGKYNIDYFACCAMLADQLKDFSIFERLLLKAFPEFLKKYPNLFTSLPVASNLNGINLSALRSGAEIIKKLSEPNPLNNLQFCVSANVKPNTPFFPAAYHLSKQPAFSIAIEMADEVARAFRNAPNLIEAKNRLRSKFNEIYSVLKSIFEDIGKKYEIFFSGIDFSPAPSPKLTRSIGYALEKLNITNFGHYGNLLIAALIKQCIPKDDKIIGFSGFMQPVLEDYIIAKRASEGIIDIDRLMLYSTMCGTGLDCIPLPGDITEREIFYILLDICTISVILNKPLSARLMPFPGKKAGDEISYDFEYFANTKVLNYRKIPENKKKDLYYNKEKFFQFI